MSDPNDLDADATLPSDPLGSTIPAPPPDFEVERPAWFYTMRTPTDWDGFSSDALDEDDHG